MKNSLEQLVKDPKEMADILQNQYKSVFSDPDSATKVVPTATETLSYCMENINLSCDEIITAIKEIDINAASCPDDIPVKILHKCCEILVSSHRERVCCF